MQDILDGPGEGQQKKEPIKGYRILRWIEIPFLGLLILGLGFRLMSWPGGSFFIMLSISLLAMLYFVSGIIPAIANRGGGTTVYGIFTGLGLSAALMGVLFRLMYWPGSIFNLGAGALVCGICLVIGLLNQRSETSDLDKEVIGWSMSRLIPVVAWSAYYLLRYL